MHNKFLLSWFVVLVMSLTVVPALSAEVLSNPDREKIITRALNCASQQAKAGRSLDWNEVCVTGDSGEVPPDDVDLMEMEEEFSDAMEMKENADGMADSIDMNKSRMDVTMDESGNIEVDGKVIPADTDTAIDTAIDIDTELDTETDYFDEPMLTSPESDYTHSPSDDIKATQEEMTARSRRNNRVNGLWSRESSLMKLEMGTDVYRFLYKEPGLMKDKGYMYGLFGTYTYRRSENRIIASLRDLFNPENELNMFRIEGRFNYGKVDYESEGTGTLDDVRDYTFELRALAGYDIRTSETMRYTPYMGFGFRYLNDDSGGKTTTTGHFGYERESQYAYIPVGLEIEKKVSEGLSVGASVEYDALIDGTQKSHLQDVDPGFSELRNDQNKGFGIRGAFRVTTAGEALDFFVEPFVRYWKINDSEVSPIIFNGSVISFDDTTILVGLEPENNSTEYGFKLGVRY